MLVDDSDQFIFFPFSCTTTSFQDPVDEVQQTAVPPTFSFSSGTATVPIRYLNPTYPNTTILFTVSGTQYTIIVRRLDRSTDASLSDLVLGGGLNASAPMSGRIFSSFGTVEGYLKAVSAYAAEVEEDTASVTVTATLSNAFQRILVIDANNVVLTTGNATAVPIALTPGVNTTLTVSFLSCIRKRRIILYRHT